jgi:hypothetical protein
MEEKDNPVSISKGEWQTVRGNALVASVQYGRWNYRGPGFSSAPGKVSTTDIVTLYVTGDNFSINGRDQDDHRDHTKAVVSYYKPDLLKGNHEFKLGFDHLYTSFNDGYGAIGENNQNGYQLVFNNGAPFQLNTRNTPAKGLYTRLRYTDRTRGPRAPGHAQRGAPLRAGTGWAPGSMPQSLGRATAGYSTGVPPRTPSRSSGRAAHRSTWWATARPCPGWYGRCQLRLHGDLTSINIQRPRRRGPGTTTTSKLCAARVNLIERATSGRGHHRGSSSPCQPNEQPKTTVHRPLTGAFASCGRASAGATRN